MITMKRALTSLALGGALTFGGAVGAQQAPGGHGELRNPGEPGGRLYQGARTGTQDQMQQEPTGSANQVSSSDMAASMTEPASAMGTVQSLDRDRRTAVIKDDAGRTFKVQVPSDLSGFDQLATGQRVNVQYYDSVAVSLMTSGAMGGTRAHVEPARQGGLVGREVTTAAQVVSIDPRTRQLDLRLANGQSQRVTVSDAELQRQLRELRPGQMATVTYTEAVATSLQPVRARSSNE
jgi:hypothetical protein